MKDTARTWIAALLLAAIVPAQTGAPAPVDPAAALARAKLLEAQEGDLPAADAAYRAILGDPQAQALHQEAALRLGTLLWRLDRKDEGTPFLERAVALGGELAAQATAVLQGQGEAAKQAQERFAKAQALVARIDHLAFNQKDTQGNTIAATTATLDAAVRELKWLGEPAAQALAARFDEFPTKEAISLQMQNGAPVPNWSLFVRIMWEVGTPPAREFLQRAAADDSVDWRRFVTAQIEPGKIAKDLEPAFAKFLRDPDPTGEVQRNLQSHASYLSLTTLAQLAASDHLATRATGLSGLATVWPNLPAEARATAFRGLEPIVRSAARGEDPRARTAAWALVQAFAFRGPAAARRLVLELLPDFPNTRGDLFSTMNAVGEFVLGDAEFALLVAGAREPVTDEAHRAMELLLAAHTPAWTAASLDGLVEMVEAGYAGLGATQPSWFGPFFTLASPQQLGRCLRALPRTIRLQTMLLQKFVALAPERLPADLFEVVRELVDATLREPVDGWPLLQANQGQTANAHATRDLKHLLYLVGRSRSAAAPAWLLSLVERAPGTADEATETLVQLSGEDLGETAWAALRTMLVWPGTAGVQLDSQHRARAFAELARRGDPAAIPLFPRAYELGLYAIENAVQAEGGKLVRQDGLRAKGIGHLGLSRDAQNQPGAPLHGYQDVQLANAWRILLQSDARDAVWEEIYSMKERIPLAVLPVLADELPAAFARATPQQRTSELWNLFGTFGRVRADDVAAGAPSRAAIASLLRTADPELASNVLAQLHREVALTFQEEALALLQRTPFPGPFVGILQRAGLPVSSAAWQIALQDAGPHNRVRTLHDLPVPLPIELRPLVEQLLRDDDTTVRAAACSALGRMFAADAVPALLASLQDREEEVRKAATQALERIRFQNEQQAYWRDAKSGIDTSPQSAASKLLRQAQPQEAKEQRLLALRSLGVLGTAEALPYLIDWTMDADADVAAAARAAIAAIHGKAAAK